MKYLSIFFTLFLFANFSFLTAQNISVPDKHAGYVTDLTGSLSSDEIEKLEKQLKLIQDQFNAQIFLLISDTTGNDPVESYTLAVAESWQPGEKGKDNGAIFAIFLEDRKSRIETGYGLEGALPDVICKTILRNTLAPRLKEGNLYEGIYLSLIEFEINFQNSELPLQKNDPALQKGPNFTNEIIKKYGMISHSAAAVILLLLLLLSPFAEGDCWKREYSGNKITNGINAGEYFSLLAYKSMMTIIGGAIGWGIYSLAMLFIAVIIENPPEVEDLSPVWMSIVIWPPLYISIFIVYFQIIGNAKKRSRSIADEIQKDLNNHNLWKDVHAFFEPSQVDAFKSCMAAALDRGQKSLFFTGQAGALKKVLNKAHRRPELLFGVQPQAISEKIEDLLRSNHWESLKETYDAEQILLKKNGFLSDWKNISASEGNSVKSYQLYQSVKNLLKHPEYYLDYPLSSSLAEIDRFLKDDALWSKWLKQFKKKLVLAKKTQLENKRNQIEKNPEKARSAAMNLLRQDILPLKRKPHDFLAVKKRRSFSKKSKNYDYLQDAYIYSSDSYSDSSDSSGVSGGGGGFGGGGASDSW